MLWIYIVDLHCSFDWHETEMDSSSSQPENKTGKTNMNWTQDMDNLLIDTLAEQVNLGNKVDKSFKSPAYTAAARAISTKFSVECTQGHIRNRLKTIKRNFVILPFESKWLCVE